MFSGHGRLMERPRSPYDNACLLRRISHFSRENGVLSVEGRTDASGTYELPGDVSSQFITGLMYSLPMLEGDSRDPIDHPAGIQRAMWI